MVLIGDNMKYKIKEKFTRRTWLWIPALNLCIMTGYRILIECGKSGYSEINDDGEPVLDSWINEPFYVTLSI